MKKKIVLTLAHTRIYNKQQRKEQKTANVCEIKRTKRIQENQLQLYVVQRWTRSESIKSWKSESKQQRGRIAKTKRTKQASKQKKCFKSKWNNTKMKWYKNNSLAPQISNMKLTSSIALYAECHCCRRRRRRRRLLHCLFCCLDVVSMSRLAMVFGCLRFIELSFIVPNPHEWSHTLCATT